MLMISVKCSIQKNEVSYLDFKLWRFCLNFSFMGMTSLAWMFASAVEKRGWDSWQFCDQVCLKSLQITCKIEPNCARPRTQQNFVSCVSCMCAPPTKRSSSQLLFFWGCQSACEFWCCDAIVLEKIRIYQCKPMSFFLWPLQFTICALLSSSSITSRKPLQFSPAWANWAEEEEGNTFSQVHGLRVLHYPVVLRIPAVTRGVYRRQLNTVFPADVKSVTGSLEKRKNKAIHSKKN